MRKPATPPKKTAPLPAEPDEPADGRALQRARQFALQRGLPTPGPQPPAAPQRAAPGKRAARKKP
jgi:hypothetical protein